MQQSAAIEKIGKCSFRVSKLLSKCCMNERKSKILNFFVFTVFCNQKITNWKRWKDSRVTLYLNQCAKNRNWKCQKLHFVKWPLEACPSFRNPSLIQGL